MWAGPTETTFLYPWKRFEMIVTFGPFSRRCDWVKSGSSFWTCLIGAAGQSPILLFLPSPRLLLLQRRKRWRGPEDCGPHPSYRPTLVEQARSGPFKEEESDQYLRNLDKFVRGGGKAFVGRHFVRPGDASYLDLHPSGLSIGGVGEPRKPFSSAYEFLVLVSPDGYLQGVTDIRKNLKTQVEWDFEVFFGAVDFAMTILMFIEIVPIAVVLFRLGAKMATRATIRAINFIVDREAKALLREVDILTEAELKAAWGGNPGAGKPLLSAEDLNKPVPQAKSISGPKRRLERPERTGAIKIIGVLDRVRNGSAKTAAEIEAEIQGLLPKHRVQPLKRELAGWMEIDVLENNPGAFNDMRVIYRVKPNGEWEVKLLQIH